MYKRQIHAADALGIIQRLDVQLRSRVAEPLNIVCDPIVLSGLVFQRLVPKLCPHCKIPLRDHKDSISPDLLARLHRIMPDEIIWGGSRGEGIFVRGTGCEHCQNSGHPGLYKQTVVAEVVAADPWFLSLLRQRKHEEARRYWLSELQGMTYLEHLQDNLRTYSPLEPLTDEDREFLEQTAQLLLRYPTVPCNDCQYCMPCPYGLDIPGILLHYNRCVNEGNVPSSSQDDNYRRARRAFLVGYDRSVPRLRQASHCIGCGQCIPHCPQSIDIPKELHRIDRFVEDLKQGREF